MSGAFSWLIRKWTSQTSSKVTSASATPDTPSSGTKASQSRTQPIILSNSALSNLPSESFPDPSRGTCTWQTLFSAPSTTTESLTVGIASCPPREQSHEGYLALHRHKQAEIYHIISGHGMLKIDSLEHEVARGDVVFIPGNAEHGIWNTDGENELRWLYCFAVDGFREVVYRFSDGSAA